MGKGSLLLLVGLPMLAQNPATQEAPEAELLRIRRICVERITGTSPLAEAIREVAFASLYASKRFLLLEKCDKAEATLKGAVIENAERRNRAESEGIGFGSIVGGASSSGGAIGGVAGSSGEVLSSSEVRRQATVTLRLVDSDGTVIWAYSQDSSGGKNRGPAVDAIDRAIRQLVRDAGARATASP